MIPSDHFVLMYNELFKMIDELGGDHLERYWQEIARLQETIVGPIIADAGFAGMGEYWGRIIEEENCKADISITEDYFELRMRECPSLSKNLVNDAGLFERYCDHCAGWIGPVLAKHGYHLVYDIISRTEPRCVFRAYRDTGKANEYLKTTIFQKHQASDH